MRIASIADDDAVGVVGGTGGRRQRIEMRAHEHDFVAQHRILAGNLRDHVVAVADRLSWYAVRSPGAVAASRPRCIIRTSML